MKSGNDCGKGTTPSDLGCRSVAIGVGCAATGSKSYGLFPDGREGDEKALAEMYRTKVAIDKARSKGHWRCVRDLEKKLSAMKRDWARTHQEARP